MGLKLFHAFVNPVADQAGFTGTKPSHWNEALEYSNAAQNAPSGTDVQIRELLTATRNYFVRADGSDSNDGLTNTAGGAFRQINKAIQVVSATLDAGGQDININVGDGSYDPVTILDWVGTTPTNFVNIIGNTGTPANVTITSTTSFVAPIGAQATTKAWAISGMKLVASGAAAYTPLVWGIGNGVYLNFTAMDFGAVRTDSPQLAATAGAYLEITGSNNFTGATAGNGLYVDLDSIISAAGCTFVYSNNPAYSIANFQAKSNGTLNVFNMTFTNGGTVTGVRYLADTAGGIHTGSGASATYVPGNSAGTATAPGWYD